MEESTNERAFSRALDERLEAEPRSIVPAVSGLALAARGPGRCRALEQDLILTGRPVAIIGGVRIPFARSGGAYADAGNLEMLTFTLAALVKRFALAGTRIDEVAAGAVMKDAADWNLAREATLGSGLDPRTPAFDVQRACGTSLTATLELAARIARGEIESAIAGGVDSISTIPLHASDALAHIARRSGSARTWRGRLAPWLGLRPRHLLPRAPAAVEPRTGLSMGAHCERMAQDWRITREEQDAFALASHRRAAEAWDEGFYDDLVTPWRGLERDNNVRRETSAARLAALPTVFERAPRGSLTAGNSSPLTDGASCVLLASEAWARERGFEVDAYLTHSGVAAVDFAGLSGPAEGLLMAPAYAVPAMLERAQLSLEDFAVCEFHEAFAAQVLCTLRAWASEAFCRDKLGRAPLGSLPSDRINPHGGSVALGHPYAATGTRIVATLAKSLRLRGSGRGLVAVCTAGGMGVCAVLER